MKLKLLLFFSAILLLSSCLRDGHCVPPHCSRVDLNELLSVELDLCTALDEEDICFSEADLSQVDIVSKLKSNNQVISVDSLVNLANFNNIITLGKSGIPLRTNEAIGFALDLDFEVVIINTGHRFTISDIEIIDANRDNLCECPKYEIAQLRLNDELITVKSALAQLNLKK